MKNILFMCVANSARSQMAEGIARQVLGPTVRVESAGLAPSSVNPLAVLALQELGINIKNHRSKSIDDLPSGFIASLDLVVTLCAEEVCPVLPTQARKLQWPLPDPAGAPGTDDDRLGAFRNVRDSIYARIKELVASKT